MKKETKVTLKKKSSPPQLRTGIPAVIRDYLELDGESDLIWRAVIDDDNKKCVILEKKEVDKE